MRSSSFGSKSLVMVNDIGKWVPSVEWHRMTRRVLLLVYYQQIATSHLREGMLERNCFSLRLPAANVEMFKIKIFGSPCVL